TEFNTIKVGEGQGFGSLEGMYVPPSVHHQLQQFSKFMRDPRGMDPKSLSQNFLDKMESLTSTWKMAKIVWDVGAQTRDMIGSLHQMVVKGVNLYRPKQWQSALESAKNASIGKLDT